MRVVHGYSLLILQALSVRLSGQDVPISPSLHCLDLKIPPVREVLRYEEFLMRECGSSPDVLQGNLIEERRKGIPSFVDVPRHKDASLVKNQPIVETQPSTLDQPDDSDSPTAIKSHPKQNAKATDKSGDPEQVQPPSSEEQIKPKPGSPISEKKIIDKINGIPSPIEPDAVLGRSTKLKTEIYEKYTEFVSRVWSTSSLQKFDMASFSPGSLKSYWDKIGIPPTNPKLWTAQDYAVIASSVSASILTSIGLISISKRLFQKSTLPTPDSSETKKSEDGPVKRASESDSSSDPQNTPPSTHAPNSKDGSPSRTPERGYIQPELEAGLEQKPTDHMPISTNVPRLPDDLRLRTGIPQPPTLSSGGERSAPDSTERLENEVTKHELTQHHDHSESTRSEHHTITDSDTKENSEKEEEDSSYVIVDEDHNLPHQITSQTIERDNKKLKSRVSSDDESDNTSEKSGKDFEDPFLSETKDKRSIDKQSSQSSSLVHGSRGTSGMDDSVTSHSSSSAVKMTRRKSEDENMGEHLVDVRTDVREPLDNNAKKQKPEIIRRVTIKDDSDESSDDDQVRTDKSALPYVGQRGESALKRAINRMPDDQEETRLRMSDIIDRSQAQSPLWQSADKDIADEIASTLESLDAVLGTPTSRGLSGDATTRRTQRTASSLGTSSPGTRSPGTTSRAEQAIRSPVRSVTSSRSSSTTWNRNRWSSPTGRRTTTRPLDHLETCEICRRNAQLEAEEKQSSSITSHGATSASRPSQTSTSVSRTSPRITSSSTVSDSSKRISLPARPTSPTSPVEEEKVKRTSFRRTLSQILSSSQSKSSSSLTTGVSSKTSSLKGEGTFAKRFSREQGK